MDKYELKKRATDAVRSFFEKKASLNEAITEIAQEDDLSPHHIERICEMANLGVREKLYKDPDVDQSRVVFPPAESKIIIAIIKKPGGNESDVKETCPLDNDYMQSPKITLRVSRGKDDELENKKASLKLEGLKGILQKLEVYKQAAKGEIEKEARYFERAQVEYMKEVRDQMTMGTTAEDIVKAAAAVDYNHFQRTFHIIEEQLPKQASLMLEHMNPDLCVTYVNGDSPLVIKYKGSVTSGARIRDKFDKMKELDDKIDSYKKVIEVEEMGKKAGWGGFGMTVVPEVLSAYGEKKNLDAEIARADSMAKDPGVANQAMQAMIEKNPKIWKAHQKKNQGNKWLTETMGQKLKTRRESGKIGSDKRLPIQSAIDKNRKQNRMGNVKPFDTSYKASSGDNDND